MSMFCFTKNKRMVFDSLPLVSSNLVKTFSLRHVFALISLYSQVTQNPEGKDVIEWTLLSFPMLSTSSLEDDDVGTV